MLTLIYSIQTRLSANERTELGSNYVLIIPRSSWSRTQRVFTNPLYTDNCLVEQKNELALVNLINSSELPINRN